MPGPGSGLTWTMQDQIALYLSTSLKSQHVKRFDYAARTNTYQRINISNCRLILSRRCGMSNHRLSYDYPTMLSPPSTGITAPLIQVMLGSARAVNTFATSSGVVKRPPGLMARALATYGS